MIIKFSPVSIPHRYAKNSAAVRGWWYWMKVSIPHRYAKNEIIHN